MGRQYETMGKTVIGINKRLDVWDMSQVVFLWDIYEKNAWYTYTYIYNIKHIYIYNIYIYVYTYTHMCLYV
jgi:hypothetical protein